MPRPHLRAAARATGVALAALLVLVSTPAAAGPPARPVLVTCAPGFPGTTAEAQPAMDALAAALARAAALP